MSKVFSVPNPQRCCGPNIYALGMAIGVCVLSGLILPGDALSQDTASNDPYTEARHELVRMRIAAAGVTNARVLDAIRNTKRHEFVPKELVSQSYMDMALPIGDSQTISSPFIVALMTELLDPQPTDKVLEVGTGSGYQAAVLSPLVAHVYSIEIVPSLGKQAAKVLKRLGYTNVSTRIGDGYLGWPEAAPLDKIIVTCSPESVPQPLIDQLREGGKMIIPVGERYQQTLYELTKKDGKLVRKPLRPTLFVPMTGAAEDRRKSLPDRSMPQVVNGDFEQVTSDANGENAEFIKGWYYGRQVKRVEANRANDVARFGSTQAFARFENETPGLDSHLLQGIPIDGGKVSTIRLSGRVRTHRVKKGPAAHAHPLIAISFYDDERNELGTFWLGPYDGTMAWKSVSRLVQVPVKTHEAILRIGLFGATGRADFDSISLDTID